LERKIITFPIDPEIYKQLQQVAKKRQVAVADVVRPLIKNELGLKNPGPPSGEDLQTLTIQLEEQRKQTGEILTLAEEAIKKRDQAVKMVQEAVATAEEALNLRQREIKQIEEFFTAVSIFSIQSKDLPLTQEDRGSFSELQKEFWSKLWATFGEAYLAKWRPEEKAL
jgi:hypothetical protein